MTDWLTRLKQLLSISDELLAVAKAADELFGPVRTVHEAKPLIQALAALRAKADSLDALAEDAP